MNISRRAWMDTGPLSRAQYEEKFLEPFVEHYPPQESREICTSFKMVPYFYYCRLCTEGSATVIRNGVRTTVPWNHPWVMLDPDYFNNQFALCA